MARSGPALVAHLPFGEAASLARWKVEATAAEVVEELSRAAGHGAYPARIGRLWTLDDEGAVRRVDVGPVTTCPACGGHLRGERRGPEARRAASSEVRDAAPIVDEAGGSRSIGPEEASRRAEAALANVGVSLTLHGLPDAADPRLRAIACPYFAASHVARFSPRATVAFPRFGASAFGKGATVEQARCSALFEWIERNCAQWTGRSELVTASLDEVRDRALDVGALAAGRLPGLPRGETRPFDAGEAIDWVWGRCLRSHRPMLVPAASVFLTAALFRGSDLDLPNQGSSGLSAGCSLADATLQGLLEIVERDAAYTAMRNGLVRPAIDLASLDDPATRAIADRAARAGYELVLRDITSSLGVATVEAYLLRSGEYVHHFAVGYGAHLDPTIAARRAVTEAAQALYFDATRSETDPLRSEASYFEVFPHRAQALDRRGPAVPLSSLPRLVPSRADAWDLVDVVVERVTAAIAGCDVCVVDLSWPEMEGIFVVRCLVTGAFDEVRPVQLHVPERCRLVPLDQMYLGRAML
jgi:ribosomal protein S12 methylthiotransferase accessory factor